MNLVDFDHVYTCFETTILTMSVAGQLLNVYFRSLDHLCLLFLIRETAK